MKDLIPNSEIDSMTSVVVFNEVSKYIIFVVTMVLWLAYQCVHMLTVIGHNMINIPKSFLSLTIRVYLSCSSIIMLYLFTQC